ncbi:MAG: hypothetical protein HYX75_20245 [Acidobacteria bacterium]|nr:hypothetical protein [Acidobacteriota bacterium]
MPLRKHFQDAIDQGVIEIDFGEFPRPVDRDGLIECLLSTLSRQFGEAPEQMGVWLGHGSIRFLELDPNRFARGDSFPHFRVLYRIDREFSWYGAPIWMGLLSRCGEDRSTWSEKWVGWARDVDALVNGIDLRVFIERVHSIVKSNYPTLFGAEPSLLSDERIAIIGMQRVEGTSEWRLNIRHEADVEFWPSNPHTHVNRIEALLSADLTNHSILFAGPAGDDGNSSART